MKKTLSGAQLIYKSLQYYNIRHVFGYSGGAVLPLLDTFYKDNNDNNTNTNNNIEFIKNSNEQCSGHAAEGYSKGLKCIKPGVIVSTSGPGVTNILTPLQNAYSDGTPLIAITGQVPTSVIGTDAFQECPATDITGFSTKWNILLEDVNDIPNIMREAYNICMSPRMGPVHIDVPKDILTMVSIYDNKELIYKLERKNTIVKDVNYILKTNISYFNENNNTNGMINNNTNENIDLIINKILSSKKPIFKIGQGCIDSTDIVTNIVNKYSIPVTTTIHGLGVLSETHNLSLGMMGMHGSAAANYALQEADLIIGIGTRFDDRIVGNIKKYAPNALNETGNGIIHIDSSLKQINKVRDLFINNHGKDVKLISYNSSSKEFLERLHKHIDIKNKKELVYRLIKDRDYYKLSTLFNSYGHFINFTHINKISLQNEIRGAMIPIKYREYLSCAYNDVNNNNINEYENNSHYDNNISDWIDRIDFLKKTYKFSSNNTVNRYKEPHLITTQEAIKNINKNIGKLLDREKVLITTGVGNHQMFAAQFITWTHPGKMITSGSQGTMGVGVPFAIGAKLSNPENTLIVIDGDGSFCMTCSELQTVSELNIPIKICIMNDKRQQMVHTWQSLFFEKRFIGTNNHNPDFVKLGESYGIKSIRCENVYDLDKTTIEMLTYNKGPILVEYNVEPDICLPLVSPGNSLSNMILNLEDIDNMKINIGHVPS